MYTTVGFEYFSSKNFSAFHVKLIYCGHACLQRIMWTLSHSMQRILCRANYEISYAWSRAWKGCRPQWW